MKNIYITLSLAIVALLVTGAIGCKKGFLDIQPPSSITPDVYLQDESQLAAYTMNRYNYLTPFRIGMDINTDNQMSNIASDTYTANQYQVPLNGGNWSFAEIYQINNFLDDVLPRWNAGTITGSQEKIAHYIGEMYFFRANQYVNKLYSFGDFPIIKHRLSTRSEDLIAASKRMPQNEVARFIISDLDSAILLMSPSPIAGGKNRLYGTVAQLLKSRIALYEASWLKYFKNTAFVPGTADWPGKGTYPEFQYAAGSIEAETNWFYERAIESAEAVADAVALTPNTKTLRQSVNDLYNPYLEMYGAVDMESFSEILLWQKHDIGLGIVHANTGYAATGNYSAGLTRGLMDSYLMADGRPTYAATPGLPYKGDDITSDLVQNRDPRMFLFVKQPWQVNGLIGSVGANTKGHPIEPYPDIYTASPEDKYTTGFACRKGWNPDIALWVNLQSSTGRIVYRAAEAYLNYIEAYYERYGTINGKADGYWKALRTRAGIAADYNITISNTVMSRETLDWGAYSGGQLLSDATLYNIRRERRVELMAEGFRMMDLKRWRSLDQLKTTPYHVEGLKIYSDKIAAANWFGPNSEWLVAPYVSPRSESEYMKPLEVMRMNNPIVNQGGVTWRMAHYLEPIAISNFKAGSLQSSGFTDSPIYQNPFWGMVSGEPAKQ